MDNKRFERIVDDKMSQLAALMSPMASVRGGQRVCYNAYFNGTEVVVLGYQYGEDGSTFTKPVAILVDEEVFGRLRVDEEASRTDASGADTPKKVL